MRKEIQHLRRKKVYRGWQKHREDWSLNDLADMFGITGSRIYQIIDAEEEERAINEKKERLIKEAWEDTDYSMEDLAAIFDLSTDTIYHILDNKFDSPFKKPLTRR